MKVTCVAVRIMPPRKSLVLLKNWKSAADSTIVVEVVVHMASDHFVEIVAAALLVVIACPFVQIVLPPRDLKAPVLT